MKTFISTSIWALVLALCAPGLAVPHPNAEIAARNAEPSVELERRGGFHTAYFYDSFNCLGGYTKADDNFGCGGRCYSIAAYSIFLTQETEGNPKPTANLYTAADCAGSPQSAGIWSGSLTGCTNSNNGQWRSAYVYFNC